MKAGTDNPNLWTLPVAFLAGIAVGVLLTVWHTGGWHAETAQPAAGTGASEREETPRAWSQDEPSRISPVGRVAKPASDLRDAAMVVSVVDALGREKSRVVTARLGNGGVLVLPLPTLRGAVSLIARDRRGREQPVTEVLAFDAESGLVAVSVNSSGERALQISSERHPLYLGGLLILWCSPVMTANLLVLYATLSVYLVIGARLEEIRLVRAFGEPYIQYQAQVPMLIPNLARIWRAR